MTCWKRLVDWLAGRENQPVREVSGGWKSMVTRTALGRLLVAALSQVLVQLTPSKNSNWIAATSGASSFTLLAIDDMSPDSSAACIAIRSP